MSWFLRRATCAWPLHTYTSSLYLYFAGKKYKCKWHAILFSKCFFLPIRYGYTYYFSQTRGVVRVLCSVQLRVSLWCRCLEASTLGSEGQWRGTVLTLTWEDEVCEHNFMLLQLSVSLTVLCLFALLIAATRYSTALPYNTGGYIMDSAWGKVSCCCVTQQDQWFTSAL